MDVSFYFFILLIAHILGDFYFQTEEMAKLKEECYKGVLIHALEYLAVSVCVMIPISSWKMVIAAVVLAAFHWLIDTIKYVVVKGKKKIGTEKIFVCDQALHITSILILSYILFEFKTNISSWQIIDDIFIAYRIEKIMFVRWSLAILCLCKPANILIQNLLSGFKPKKMVRV